MGLLKEGPEQTKAEVSPCHESQATPAMAEHDVCDARAVKKKRHKRRRVERFAPSLGVVPFLLREQQEAIEVGNIGIVRLDKEEGQPFSVVRCIAKSETTFTAHWWYIE